MRIRFRLAYDGTNYHGWARQPNLETVQGTIENALNEILRIKKGEQPVRLVVAGRTDTGVHAAEQVCHADIDEDILLRCKGHMPDSFICQALQRRLSAVLPQDIVIMKIDFAPEGFDARFSAEDRVYVYRIAENPEDADPRIRSFVLQYRYELDVEKMNQAAQCAIGLHDFGSFATPNPGGTTIRKVKYAFWQRVSDTNVVPAEYCGESGETSGREASDYAVKSVESGLLTFTIIADAFAHNMVRSLVNACLAVGRGKKTVEWMERKIRVPEREGQTGPAPACGLTLEKVLYPEESMLAVRAQAIRAKRTLDE